MNKLENLEVLKDYMQAAYNKMNWVEQIMEAGVLTDDQENKVIEISDSLGDLITDLQDLINHIKEKEEHG